VKTILDTLLKTEQAALWFLGQSGFVIRSCGKTIVIDPYLSDSVAKVSPKLTRLYPPPIQPFELNADIFIVTHDHLDHLDPETIKAYRHIDTTTFVGPRFACKKLHELGIPGRNIIKIDSGEIQNVQEIDIEGIYAIANEPAVIDTAGYKLAFPNGRSIYHSADTGFSDLLLKCTPHVEVALVCMNGQWGNLNIDEAAELVKAVKPQYAIPHHYDLMALNSKNPEIFKYQINTINPDIEVKILKVLEPFIW
jgi:L-ascorbate 6-phosphate lactonase